MESNDRKIKSIVDTAILVALAIVLKLISDLIPFLNFFEGGTIDLAMLPILLIGLRNGAKYGFTGATLYWLVSWMIGGFKIYSGFPLLEITLDRFIPYTIGYGVMSFYSRKRENTVFISFMIVVCGILRLVSHTLSGAFLWYSWTGLKEFSSALLASFIYNATYVGFTTLIALVIFVSARRICYLKSPLIFK